MYRSLLLALVAIVSSCHEKIPDGFQLQEGFSMTLVAAEPLVFDPVDMEFDAQGRAFVLEMPGYPWAQEGSRLVCLQDLNGDGIFDKRTLYAENLRAATSILPYRQGFLVAAPPYILYIADRDKDLKEDHREIILNGFEEGNTQHNINGLTYGLDNWIYAANGGNDGSPFWADDSSSALPLRGQDFRFKIDTKELQLWGRSSGGFELAMDHWGRLFETHNLTHISHLVIPSYYHQGSPLISWSGLENISDHEEDNGLARIYPLGLQETRVNHPEQSGYFSGACGVTFYGGSGFPEGFNNNIFVADVVLNLVHRDVIKPKGSSFQAQRQDQKREFLVSSDRSFRPVNMTVGPDGALYLLDMHRQVIEHPEWIPDDIEKDLDLEAGKEKGRIYRIFPDHGLVKPDIKITDLEQWIPHLAHANQWWRITAQRLLVADQDISITHHLKAFWKQTDNPLTKAHVMWILQALGQLDEENIAEALHSGSPDLRIQGLKVSEYFTAQYPGLKGAVVKLLTDQHHAVRMQAALTASRWIQMGRLEVNRELVDAGKHSVKLSGDDPWALRALLATFQTRPIPFLEQLLTAEDLTATGELPALITSLSSLAIQGEDGLMHLLELAIAQAHRHQSISAMLQGMAHGLEQVQLTAKSGSEWAEKMDILEKAVTKNTLPACWRVRQLLELSPSVFQQRLLASAKQLAADTANDRQVRLESLALLKFMHPRQKQDLLWDLLNSQHPWALQEQALEQLGQTPDTLIAQGLIEIWNGLGPQAKTKAGNILLYQKKYHPFLLTALEQGQISVGELNFDLERRRTLLFWSDSLTGKRAQRLFSDAGVITRTQALEKMQVSLDLVGDQQRGSDIFVKSCGPCHIMNARGTEVGPNLSEINRKSPQTLLHDIIDPNAAVDTRYLAYTLETEDGKIYQGIITSETDQMIAIKQIGGIEITIARNEIRSMRTEGNSYMPEGLETQITTQEMADLLAFLGNTAK